MDLATLGLRVDSRGYVRSIDDADRANRKLESSGGAVEKMVDRLKQSFGGIVAFLGIRELVAYADSWNNIEARISLVTESTRQATVVQEELFSVAQRSRTAFEPTAELYTKLARNASALGASQKDVLRATEAITKGFVVSGASASDTASAVRQLGQAFASGTLRGDELNTVLEAAPRLAEAIAKGMGVTVGQLRKMGSEGKLSSQEVFKAVLSQSTAIDTEFKKMPVTIGQAFVVLKNEIMRFVGVGDNATEMSKKVAGVIMALARAIPMLSDALVWLWSVVERGVQLWRDLPEGVRTTVLVIAAMSLAIPKAAALVAFLTGTVTKLAAAFRAVAAAEALAAMLSPAGWLVLGLAAVATAFGYVGYRALKAAADARAAAEEFRAALGVMDDATLNKTVGDSIQQLAAIDKAIEEHRGVLAALQQMQGGPGTETTVHRRNGEAMDITRQRTELGRSIDEQIRTERATLEMLQAQEQVLLQRGNLAIEEQRRRELLNKRPDPLPVDTSLDDAARKRIAANNRMVAAARQSVELARLEGEAQAALAIDYDAANKKIDARAELKGPLLSATLAAIDLERQYRLEALRTRSVLDRARQSEDESRGDKQRLAMIGQEGAALERLRIDYAAVNREIEVRRGLEELIKRLTSENRTAEARRAQGDLDAALQQNALARERALMEARMKIIHDYRAEVQATFVDLFESIYSGGIERFSDLIDGMKRMFTRMVAEFTVKKLFQGTVDSLGGSLARVFGDLDKLKATPAASPLAAPATALTGSATSLTASATALTNAAGALSRAGGALVPASGGGTAPTEPVPVRMEGITTSTQKSLVSDMAKYIGPAVGGFLSGMMVGGMTTNRGLGTLGGAAAGAAQGAMVGSVIPGVGTAVGAVVGGITGAIGGFLGSSRRRREEERALAEVIKTNSASIARLRQTMEGELMSGANLARALQATSAALTGSARVSIAGAQSLGEAIRMIRAGSGRNRLEAAAKQFGLTLQQVESMAAQLGITLYDRAGKLIPEALGQLQEALELSARAATTFTNTLDDLRLQQDARRRLFDIDTPQQQLEDAYAQLNQMAPDLMRQLGLSNLNLDTEAGRNTLLAGLREIFDMITNGELTPELLGMFTDKGQLIEALLGAKDGLDAFKNSLSDVTTDFPKSIDALKYEMIRGRGAPPPTGGVAAAAGAEASAPPTPAPTGGVQVGSGGSIFGPVTIESYGTETGAQLLDKLEAAARERYQQGGSVYIPGLQLQEDV